MFNWNTATDIRSVEIEVPNCEIESVIYSSNFYKYKHTLYRIYAIISI